MIKTKVGCMVLGLLLLIGYLSAQKEKATGASIQIPFQLTTYNNLSIQAILNGVDTVQLMFHTAANALTLTEESVKQLKSIHFVASTDSVKSWGGQANSSRYSPKNQIQIGGLSWDNQAIWENQFSGQYTQGKFGMDLFKNWVVEIDFDQSVILLHKDLPSKIKGFQKSKLYTKDEMFFIEAACCIQDSVILERFLIHSGYAGALLINDQFAQLHQLGKQLPIVGEKKLKDSFGNTVISKQAQLPLFSIAENTLSNVSVGFFEGSLGSQPYSIIGGDLLKQFNIVIDAQRQFIYLKPNGLYHTEQQTNTNPFGKALIPDMVADASIQMINGIFYCYATTDGYDNGLKTSGPPVVWTSKDFVHWSFKGYLFPSALGQLYWAPSKAVAAHGKFYLYPTINGFMYPAVADKPTGPFKLATGVDSFYKPFTNATLLKSSNPKGPEGIDAEIFIDKDQQAYLYWQRRMAAKMNTDMISVDTSSMTIPTKRKGYSEGPIFFERKGIYYYLYTLAGDEKYQYAYVTSKQSPMGPFDFPKQDIITTTNYATGVYGPGHGNVFNIPGTDNYYIAYLEFSRASTNRQTYVNKLEFNEDGSIKPVSLHLNGVGALKQMKHATALSIVSSSASSIRENLIIKPMKDSLFKRTESFNSGFAFDHANGSRWMSNSTDQSPWLIADLGKIQEIRKSALYFVRPTAGHAYLLESSLDGKEWKKVGGHDDLKIQSPHEDQFTIKARYLRVNINKGLAGVWEWEIF
ncbi:MAG: Arabinoxylan arabinofuranohydrolase precursor [Bacteroidota bacterium]